MPTCVGDVFLLQLELVDEPLIRGRRFHRIEILALDVLDQRHLEQTPLLVRRGDVLDDDRDSCRAGALRGAPAAFAGDDLISLRGPPPRSRRRTTIG